MYIVIFENGDMNHLTEVSDDLLMEADNGVIDIIDISDNTHPIRYFDKGWCSIDVPNA